MSTWIKPAEQRKQALAPIVARLIPQKDNQSHVEIPSCFTMGEFKLPLDAWEQSVMQQSVDPNEPSEPFAPILVEGIAFQAKCLANMEQLSKLRERGAHRDLTAAQLDTIVERLITDAAIGLALLHEAQREIDRLIAAGEKASAKRMTGFRNKLSQSVTRMRERMGNEAFQRAENKSRAMISADQGVHSTSYGKNPNANGEPWKGPNEYFDPTLGLSARADEDEIEKPASKIRTLTLVLAGCCLTWAVFIAPRFFGKELHVLTNDELSHLPAVDQIKVRPPSLYLQIDEAAWDGMTNGDRKQMLVAAGQAAAQAGYTGVHVQRPNNVAVGQWLKKTGARLIEPVRPKSR